MKKFIKSILFALVILFSVFILSIFLPLIVSTFIAISTDITFQSCVTSGAFWFIAFVSLFVSSIFVNDIYNKDDE